MDTVICPMRNRKWCVNCGHEVEHEKSAKCDKPLGKHRVQPMNGTHL